MSKPIGPDDFRPHLHRVFRVKDGHHALTMTQLDVLPLGEAQALVSQRLPFTLILSGPPGDVLPEGLHTLIADDGGEFLLYVIPIQTPSSGRQDYQVVFN
jgi:hypothetical protein